MPGLQSGATRLPHAVTAKTLGFIRTRSSKSEDPFFRGLTSESIHAFGVVLKDLGKRIKISSIPHPSSDGLYTKGDCIEIPCFPFALDVITRMTTKVLCGDVLCRKKEFLELAADFAAAIPWDAMILRCFPTFARR